MPRFRTGTVTEITSERRGLQRLVVDDRPAYCLTELIGPCAVGDRVVVNTTAVDLDLGTGGFDVVHWNLSRDEWSKPGAGHVLKLRYTSLQVDVGAAEERDGYRARSDLGGRPVVACFLHSQVACVAAAFAEATSGRHRLAYVMTDSAALPMVLSDLVHNLVDAGLLVGTVTAGQAFGGDLEAVNLPSALDVAVTELAADAIVVGPGPGVVGTDSPRAFSGLEVAGTIDATVALGGRSIVCVRWSDADARPRHQGVSHHVAAALRQARTRATVAVPAGTEFPDAGHDVGIVEVPDIERLLANHRLEVTTMGRAPADDPGFFRWAAAAGVLAAEWV